jgi:16S rRNA C1402 N4-methylase RsmH
MGVILDSKEGQKKEAAKAKALHKKEEDRKTELEKQKTELMRAISEAENQVIADILEDGGVSQEIFQRVKTGRWGSFFEADKTDMENYQRIMTVRAAVNNEVKARFSKRFQKMKEHEELERVTRALAAM